MSYYQPDQFQKDQFVVLDLGEPKQIAKVEFYPRNDDNKIVTGELYELFYWDKKWISLGKQYAEDNKLIYQIFHGNLFFVFITIHEEKNIARLLMKAENKCGINLC